jgi:hypothetical protein
MRTTWFAIRVAAPRCDGENAELTARITAYQPSPEARSTCLPPTETQLSTGKSACTATVLYDGSHGCVLLSCLTSLAADWCLLARCAPGRFRERGCRLRGDPCRGYRRLRRRLCRSGSSGGPQVGHIDPAHELGMGGSNEVARGGASRHPPHDFDLSPVDELVDKGSLVVEEGRAIFSAARTTHEQLPAYSEDRAGAPRCR